MKLTPLDIHHKEFRHALRGYNEEEVDKFLDDVADEVERLFKENIDLSEKLEAASEKVRSYQEMERTLHNTMVAAQRSAEEIVEKARAEAETILRDSEVKAKEVIHNALTQKQRVAGELVRIKQAEEEFRARFKAMLEQHIRAAEEIALPEDVRVLVGETEEGTVSDVAVASVAESHPIAEPAIQDQAPAPAEGALRPYQGEALPVPTETAPFEPVSAEPAPVVEPAPAAEPPSSGFVQSMTFGEVEGPDLAAEEPVYTEPAEFPAPPEAVGEREDDVDIEQID
ncbi:MAG: DivIVA domain-containing protein [Coriobacteriia bacterium]|nr:DivIVA domain-containing protein [Coriobacteriia bacterium]